MSRLSRSGIQTLGVRACGVMVGAVSLSFLALACASGETVAPSATGRGGGSGSGSGGAGVGPAGSGGSGVNPTGSGGAGVNPTGSGGAGVNPTGSGGTGVNPTGAGGSTTTACSLPTAAQTCAGTPLRKALLIDFSTYTATGAWGNSAAGDLTGGTSMFQGAGTAALTRVVQGTAPDTSLHLTGNIPQNGYAGLVFWFGPCVNAALVNSGADGSAPRSTTGIALPLWGNLGGSQVRVQVQSHDDYPVDAPNMKGGCVFTNCDMRWTQCTAPTVLMTSVPSTPTVTSFLWGSFTGGKPMPTTTGQGVVGLQFQFECGTAPSCNIDVTIGSIVPTL